MSAPKQKWLPLDVKACKECGYKKHASGMYDTATEWPHWCFPPERK